VLLAPAAFGYIRLTYTDSSGTVPDHRSDFAGIQFYINNLIVAGQVNNASGANVTVISANSDPVDAARRALTTWNTGTGANINFLPLMTTTAVDNQSDYMMVIAMASTADLSILGYSPGKSTGAVAVTLVSVWPATGLAVTGQNVVRGDIADSDIILNSSITWSTDGSTPYDLQTVFTHELGHSLGLNHTGLLGATMFQYSSVGGNAVLTQQLLSSDEIDFANAVYPPAGAPALGTIAGKVVASDGSPVADALLTMVDVAGGNSISSITAADGTGTYSVQAPPASYVIYAEPMTTASVVEAQNIYSVNPAQVTSNFLPTLLGGAATPMTVTVTAGNTATAPNLTVNGGSNSLSQPGIAFGKAGGSGDIMAVHGFDGPQTVASGQSLDIAFASGGLDGTESVQIFGPGITITGVAHVDKSANIGQPLIRTTIGIASRQTPALASIFISKPTGALSMSGILVMVPPTPAFVSNGVVSATGYTGGPNGNGAVSPGGLSTIYAIPNTPNLGPATSAQPNGYDAYGKVPTTLAGVGVTFDGLPAPMFYSSSGQLNLQVPFELAGKTSTMVQVNYLGSLSAPVKVAVVPAQPAFFTYSGGTIVGNQDYSLNTAKNPAARGSVVSIYGTGIGQSSYTVVTGQGAPDPPAGYTGGNQCLLNGTTLVNVAFTGWTPTAVGLAQWSMVLPTGGPTGMVTVTCTAPSGATTQQGNIYID
jgi:uncharacterized protein (TIGR03437 family)